MSKNWHYSKNGQEHGPVPAVKLKQIAAGGGFGPDDLVWQEGMPSWVPAKQIKGLFPSPTSSNDIEGSSSPPSSEVVPESLGSASFPELRHDRLGTTHKHRKSTNKANLTATAIVGAVCCAGIALVVLIYFVNSSQPTSSASPKRKAQRSTNPSNETAVAIKEELIPPSVSRIPPLNGEADKPPPPTTMTTTVSSLPRRITVLDRKQATWQKSQHNFARTNDMEMQVGIGDRPDGVGAASAGLLISGVDKVVVEVSPLGSFRRFDDNSFVGFLVDYSTKSGFTKRVALSFGFHSVKRWDTNPAWGTAKLPNEFHDIGRAGKYELDLRKYSPPDWDGSVWLTSQCQNAGRGITFTATVVATAPDPSEVASTGKIGGSPAISSAQGSGKPNIEQDSQPNLKSPPKSYSPVTLPAEFVTLDYKHGPNGESLNIAKWTNQRGCLVEEEGFMPPTAAPATGSLADLVKDDPRIKRSKEYQANNGPPPEERIIHGVVTIWLNAKRQQRLLEEYCFANMKHGPSRLWNEHGQLMVFGMYRKGRKHGQWSYWHDNGRLATSETYTDGALVGEAKTFFASGQAQSIVNYRAGKRHGAVKRWSESGKLLVEGQYKDGDPIPTFLVARRTCADFKAQAVLLYGPTTSADSFSLYGPLVLWEETFGLNKNDTGGLSYKCSDGVLRFSYRLGVDGNVEHIRVTEIVGGRKGNSYREGLAEGQKQGKQFAAMIARADPGLKAEARRIANANLEKTTAHVDELREALGEDDEQFQYWKGIAEGIAAEIRGK